MLGVPPVVSVEQVGGLDGLRVHDLRHTAATLAAAGATTRELMVRMGHLADGGRGVAMRPAGDLPGRMVERVTGIEPASRAWKARALPLSYTRVWGERISRRGPGNPGGCAGASGVVRD